MSDKVPIEYIDPITGKTMTDPVTMPDGQNYERQSIIDQLKINKKSLFTDVEMSINQIVPNHKLKKEIQDYLKKVNSKTIKVIVKNLNNATYIIEIDDHATVYDLKKEISKRDGIDVSYQQVMFKKPLNDNDTLISCGIENNSIVHSMGKQRGG